MVSKCRQQSLKEHLRRLEDSRSLGLCKKNTRSNPRRTLEASKTAFPPRQAVLVVEERAEAWKKGTRRAGSLSRAQGPTAGAPSHVHRAGHGDFCGSPRFLQRESLSFDPNSVSLCSWAAPPPHSRKPRSIHSKDLSKDPSPRT